MCCTSAGVPDSLPPAHTRHPCFNSYLCCGTCGQRQRAAAAGGAGAPPLHRAWPLVKYLYVHLKIFGGPGAWEKLGGGHWETLLKRGMRNPGPASSDTLRQCRPRSERSVEVSRVSVHKGGNDGGCTGPQFTWPRFACCAPPPQGTVGIMLRHPPLPVGPQPPARAPDREFVCCRIARTAPRDRQVEKEMISVPPPPVPPVKMRPNH
jgi:hypothetical protein